MNTPPQLSVSALAQLLGNDPLTRPNLVDVREPWEWDLARIDGALHIPMQQIPSRQDEIDRAHPTVVYCHHGVRSLQVVAFLQRVGFTQLHNLAGGIDAWSREVDRDVPLY